MSQSIILITNSKRCLGSMISTPRFTQMRWIRFAVGALILASETGSARINDRGPNPTLGNYALYESVEDPREQQPRRILVEGNVFHFGQVGDRRESLLRSDLGFPIYFVRVKGGVRAREQPIIFPSGSRKHFDLDDYGCSVLSSATRQNVVCRSKSNGQLYHSSIVNGGLVSFDMKCFNEPERVCHYQLIGGRPIRPSRIHAN